MTLTQNHKGLLNGSSPLKKFTLSPIFLFPLFLVLLSFGPALAQSVILNGGFETADATSWVTCGGNPFPSVGNTSAHSGSFSALLGTYFTDPSNPPEPEPLGDSCMYQTVTVPDNAPSTLSFWYFPNTVALEGDDGNEDLQICQIMDSSGVTNLATVLNTLSNAQAWTQVTFDMTPFAGQTVQVFFDVYEDGFGDPSYMFVDDVSLTPDNSNPFSPTVTSTPTATLTPTNSSTPSSTPTVTQTPTVTLTPTFSPTSTLTPFPSGLVTNGSFETGNDGSWSVCGSSPAPVIGSSFPHTGAESALLGTYFSDPSNPPTEPSGYSCFYQNVAVPASGPSTLSFWYYPNTTSLNSVDGNADQQVCLILDASGSTTLATVLDTLSNAQAWTQVNYDMSSYAGQTVRILFDIWEDGVGDPSYMYVDDVSLIEGTVYTQTPTGTSTLTPRPTTTHTETFTATGTATLTPTITLTPTVTSTITPTADPTLPPLPSGLMLNGNFETGDASSWVTCGGQPWPSITGFNAHTGSYSAVLGTSFTPAQALGGNLPPEPLGNSCLYQDVAVPANAPSTLSFWYYPGASDPTGDADIQECLIQDPANSNTLATVMTGLSDAEAWTQATYDLSSFGGQTVRVYFNVWEDGVGDTTYMYLDDVALIPGAAYTATPTVTSTTTSTLTSTLSPTATLSSTPTLSPTVTSTVTLSPTPTLAPPANTGLIVNGTLETGAFSPAWVTCGGGPWPAVSNLMAHTGSDSALVGTYFSNINSLPGVPAGQSCFYQSVSVPSSAPSTLSFWYNPGAANLNNDLQQCLILNSSGSATLATVLSTLSNSQIWTQATYDLSAFGGQTVRVDFNVSSDGWNNGSAPGDPAYMFVDDISVLTGTAYTSTPTVTLTATVTSSATGTSTPSLTPTVTGTPTSTGTSTLTPGVNSPTSTGTATFTSTPTFTSTYTPTATSTSTGTDTSTPTSTATSTATLASTASLTPTNSITATYTATVTATATATPTATSSFTPTSTPTPLATAQQVVGASGPTTVTLTNGTGVVVPAGVLTSGVTITVEEISETSAPPPNSYQIALGNAYTFTAFNVSGPVSSLSGTVTLVFTFDPNLIPKGYNLNNLVVEYYDTTQMKWVALPTVLNSANDTLTVVSSHFSTWGVFLEENSSGTLGRNVIGPVPAPAGTSLCLYAVQPTVSGVWQVYNVVGQRSAYLTFGSGDECWNTGGMARGLYFIKLTLTYGDGTSAVEWHKVVLQ